MDEDEPPPWRKAAWTVSLAVGLLAAVALIAALLRRWLF